MNPTYARGGKIERKCASCGETFYAVSAARKYCVYCCKRSVQNKRYYRAHAADIIQKVLHRRKTDE